MFIEVTSSATRVRILVSRASIQIVTTMDGITSIYTEPSEKGIGVTETYDEVKQLLGANNGD